MPPQPRRSTRPGTRPAPRSRVLFTRTTPPRSTRLSATPGVAVEAEPGRDSSVHGSGPRFLLQRPNQVQLPDLPAQLGSRLRQPTRLVRFPVRDQRRIGWLVLLEPSARLASSIS